MILYSGGKPIGATKDQAEFISQLKVALTAEVESNHQKYMTERHDRGGKWLDDAEIIRRVLERGVCLNIDGSITVGDINGQLHFLTRPSQRNWIAYISEKVRAYNLSAQPISYIQPLGELVKDADSLAIVPTIDTKIGRLRLLIHEALRRPEYESIARFEARIIKCLNSRYSLNISRDGASIKVKETLLDELLKHVGSKAAPQVLLLLEEFKLMSGPDARGAFVRNFGEIAQTKSILEIGAEPSETIVAHGKDNEQDDVPLAELLPEVIPSKGGKSKFRGIQERQLLLPPQLSERVIARSTAARLTDEVEDFVVPSRENLRTHLARGQRTLFDLFDRSTADFDDPDRYFGL